MQEIVTPVAIKVEELVEFNRLFFKNNCIQLLQKMNTV